MCSDQTTAESNRLADMEKASHNENPFPVVIWQHQAMVMLFLSAGEDAYRS